MIIYNGYRDGESRTHRMPARKADKGHALVAMTTTRRGSAFAFHYKGECECGKTFGSKGSRDSIFYRHDAHLRAETSKVGA